MAWAPGPSEPSSQFKAGPPTPSPGVGGPEAFPSSRVRWSLELRGGPQEGLQEHMTSKTALEEKREVQEAPTPKWPSQGTFGTSREEGSARQHWVHRARGELSAE